MFRLLNGDIVIPSHTLPLEQSREVRKWLAQLLNVGESSIFVENDESKHEDNIHNIHNVLVLPRSVLCMDQVNVIYTIDYIQSSEWMCKCVNESVLSILLPHLPKLKHLFGNPHPRVVTAIMQYEQHDDFSDWMWANPSDIVLDYMFDRGYRISTKHIRMNSNVRAIEYVIRKTKKPTRCIDEWHDFFKHPNEQSITFVWNLFFDRKKKEFYNTNQVYDCDNYGITNSYLPSNDHPTANELRVRDYEDCYIYWTKNLQTSDPKLLRKIIMSYRTIKGMGGASRLPDHLASNPSPTMIEFLLSDPKEIVEACQKNPNDQIVSYFIDEHPELIKYEVMACNSNPRALTHVKQWLLENPSCAYKLVDKMAVDNLLMLLQYCAIQVPFETVLRRFSDVADINVVM